MYCFTPSLVTLFLHYVIFYLLRLHSLPLALPYCLTQVLLSPFVPKIFRTLVYILIFCTQYLRIKIAISCYHYPPLLHLSLISPFSGVWIFPTLTRTQKSRILEGSHREQGNTLSPPQ